LAVEAVYCELVSDFPTIREKFREFLVFQGFLWGDAAAFAPAIKRLIVCPEWWLEKEQGIIRERDVSDASNRPRIPETPKINC